MKYQPFCNTEIVFTNKYNLIEIILSLKQSRIVLILSKTAAIRWDMISFIDQLRIESESKSGYLIWIDDFASNPTQKDIIKALNQIGNREIELIVAIGGGSCIDLAKSISAFYDINKNNQYTIESITNDIKYRNYARGNNKVDIIAIPTTSGTGSEVTQWATIWDEYKTKKFSIDYYLLKPKKAIIVPELTLSMTAEMTLSSGLDAMCQAVEAYWSKHTTPLIQDIAFRSVELIVKNLRKAIDEPNNIEIREVLCRASVLAGIAFAQTKTTACHSISYPLTMLFGVSHGLAVAVTLDEVSKINKGHYPNDDLLIGLFNDNNGIQNWIDMVSENIINLRLSSFGITDKDIPLIVENAFTNGRMDNNPVNLSKDDVKSILIKLMKL